MPMIMGIDNAESTTNYLLDRDKQEQREISVWVLRRKKIQKYQPPSICDSLLGSMLYISRPFMCLRYRKFLFIDRNALRWSP
jgi:hypothetical protein